MLWIPGSDDLFRALMSRFRRYVALKLKKNNSSMIDCTPMNKDVPVKALRE